MAKCGQPCKIYSRVVGYYTATDEWNPGKAEEYKERVTFDPMPKSQPHDKYADTIVDNLVDNHVDNSAIISSEIT